MQSSMNSSDRLLYQRRVGLTHGGVPLKVKF